MELVGNIKNYEWGKLGKASQVAKLAKANNDNFAINEEAPYAELWMGTHCSGPSLLKSTGTELGQMYDEPLPYLLKVLSIRKALSIQVHPNKVGVFYFYIHIHTYNNSFHFFIFMSTNKILSYFLVDILEHLDKFANAG